MTGGLFGIGTPVGQFGQLTAGSPFGYPIGAGQALQTQPYLQSLQHAPLSYGPGPQAYGQQFGQPLQQVLQILPQQLAHVQQLLQQQFHGVQQLLQVVPQQLHQIQQLLSILPHQIHQLQFQAQQPQLGGQVGFGYNWPGIAGAQQGSPIGGVGVGSPGFGGQGGTVM